MKVISINGQDVTRAARPTCSSLISQTETSSNTVVLVVCSDPEGYKQYTTDDDEEEQADNTVPLLAPAEQVWS